MILAAFLLAAKSSNCRFALTLLAFQLSCLSTPAERKLRDVSVLLVKKKTARKKAIHTKKHVFKP